jgi:hypothetical protein
LLVRQAEKDRLDKQDRQPEAAAGCNFALFLRRMRRLSRTLLRALFVPPSGVQYSLKPPLNRPSRTTDDLSESKRDKPVSKEKTTYAN